MSSRLPITVVAVLSLLPDLLVGARAQLVFGPVQTTVLSPSEALTPIDATDVNGDGIADLVGTDDGSIRLYLGDGAGHFGVGTLLLGGVTGSELCLADLDGDQRDDLIVMSESPGRPTMLVALADGMGGFGSPASYGLDIGFEDEKLVAGDADGDGDPDILIFERGLPGQGFGEAQLFLGDGAGALTSGPIVLGNALAYIHHGIPVALDADGLPDLVLVTYSASFVPTTAALRGQPGGGLQKTWSAAGVDVDRAADLDVDGDADLLDATADVLVPCIVTAYLGAGDGTFMPGPTTELDTQSIGFVSIDVAELDTDGLPDLIAIAPGNPDAWMLPGDGAGAFVGPGARVTLLLAAFGIGASVGPLADYDGDGRIDVVASTGTPSQKLILATLNRTYPESGALLDLGGQLPSWDEGFPIQLASGSFAGGSPFSFSLFNGPASGPVYAVIGLSVLNAPFKGGTLVPNPDLLFGPLGSTPAGTLTLAGTWPSGVPSGLQLALQFWFPASSAVAGFAASSGVLVTTP